MPTENLTSNPNLYPNLNGKNVLVTGGSAGIGEVTACELSRMGAHVTIIGRSARRCQDAIERIQQELDSPPPTPEPGGLDYITADLSILSEVHRAASEYQRRYDRLDVLVNNAGTINLKRQVTADGLEMTFALNHLSYFLLTQKLLPLLESSAGEGASRIVNVASEAHRGSRLDLDDLQLEKGYWLWEAYGRSKLANVLFTFELARRLKGKPVTANTLHPGLVRTKFGRNNGPLYWLAMPFVHMVAIPLEEGAETPIYLASSPEVASLSGAYFIKKRPVRASSEACNEQTAAQLWEISQELVKNTG